MYYLLFINDDKFNSIQPSTGVLGTHRKSAVYELIKDGKRFPDGYFWQVELVSKTDNNELLLTQYYSKQQCKTNQYGISQDRNTQQRPYNNETQISKDRQDTQSYEILGVKSGVDMINTIFLYLQKHTQFVPIPNQNLNVCRWYFCWQQHEVCQRSGSY